MIFGNFGQALRVSVGPYFVGIVIAGIAFMLSGLPFASGFDPMASAFSPGAILLPFLLIPMILFITAWVAVSWHRFILLEEYAGILPAVSGRPIWPYVGKSILLGLIIILIAIPLFLIFGTLIAGVAQPEPGEISFSADGTPDIPLAFLIQASLVPALVGIPLYYVILRIGIALVGTALAKPLGFGEAWRATAKVGGMIFGVTIIMTLINLVPGWLIFSVQSISPVFASILNMCLTWLSMMLGISILTTIYGHVIEERPLIS